MEVSVMKSIVLFTVCLLVVSLTGCASGQMRFVQIERVDEDCIVEAVGSFNQGPGNGLTVNAEEPSSGVNGAVDSQGILSNTILKIGTVGGTVRYRIVGSGNQGYPSIETISDASQAKTLIGDYEAGLNDGQEAGR